MKENIGLYIAMLIYGGVFPIIMIVAKRNLLLDFDNILIWITGTICMILLVLFTKIQLKNEK